MMPSGPTRERLMAQSSTYRTALLGLRFTATLTTSQATHDADERVSSAVGPLAQSGSDVAAQASSPPNILFIVIDDVGIDQMRVFGYGEDNQPRTPNIDTIALAIQTVMQAGQ